MTTVTNDSKKINQVDKKKEKDTTITLSAESARTLRYMSEKSGKDIKQLMKEFCDILKPLLESYENASTIDTLCFKDLSGQAVVFALVPVYSGTLYGKGQDMFDSILRDLSKKRGEKQ